MNYGRSRSGKLHHHEMAVRLDSLKQFFNSMDPSPFYEKDLDPDAEHYIVSWAEEFPLVEPVSLVLHVDVPDASEATTMVEEAVHNHFRNLARLARLEFRHMMRVGSRSLAIGLAVLASCLLLSELTAKQDGALMDILRQSLLIGGWVAMWQPMQIYLYGWWPLRRRRLIYEKLGRLPVHLRAAHHPDSVHPASRQ
jgi:hypothetical protein